MGRVLRILGMVAMGALAAWAVYSLRGEVGRGGGHPFQLRLGVLSISVVAVVATLWHELRAARPARGRRKYGYRRAPPEAKPAVKADSSIYSTATGVDEWRVRPVERSGRRRPGPKRR